MKVIVILATFMVAAAYGQAQCPAFQLAELHTLQRADPYVKESKIQNMGFDLRSEFLQRGAKTRNYSKCWNSNFRQKPVYEQLLWWNTERNSITFFTLNEEHFKSLRQSIVERRTSGSVAENPDAYVGHLFMYNFGVQQVDGVEYFMISIVNRH